MSFNLERPSGSAPLLKWYTISCDSKFAQTSDQVTGRLLLEIQTYTRASFKGLPPPWELDDDDAEVPQVALSQIFWWYKGIIHITVAAGFHMPKMVIMSSLVKSLEKDHFCLQLYVDALYFPHMVTRVGGQFNCTRLSCITMIVLSNRVYLKRRWVMAFISRSCISSLPP